MRTFFVRRRLVWSIWSGDPFGRGKIVSPSRVPQQRVCEAVAMTSDGLRTGRNFVVACTVLVLRVQYSPVWWCPFRIEQQSKSESYLLIAGCLLSFRSYRMDYRPTPSAWPCTAITYTGPIGSSAPSYASINTTAAISLTLNAILPDNRWASSSSLTIRRNVSKCLSLRIFLRLFV